MFEIHKKPKTQDGEELRVGKVNDITHLESFFTTRYNCKVLETNLDQWCQNGEVVVDFDNGHIITYTVTKKG